MENRQDAFFRVDSRLLLQLGEQLVSNKAIALAELVKNSYDADAKKATIIFEKVTSPGGTITIEDDGIGITEESFINNWMRIATTDCTNNPRSKKYNRLRSGEKGIGRIACRKIAKELHIESVAEKEPGVKEKIIAHFLWDSFEPGLDVNKVPISYTVESVNSSEKTGTTLILKNTNGNWNQQNVTRLNIELAELFSPSTIEDVIESVDEKIDTNNFEKDPGFKHEIKSTEFPNFKDSLNKAFFKHAWAKITGDVDDSGDVSYHLTVINPLINKIKKDFGKDESFKTLKRVHFEIYFFVYSNDFFDGKVWKYSDAATIGRLRGGVKVYSSKFRVFGYGDPGDDWLDLLKDRSRSAGGFSDESMQFAEDDKRPGLLLFTNRSLFGHVVYDKQSNPDLQISINREKLESNDTFEELQQFVRLGINYATVIYANERLQKEILDDEKELEEVKKKQEEAKIRRDAEEAQRIAQEQEQKAAFDREKAEERERIHSEELKRIETRRKKIEEELKKIEEERRNWEIQAVNKKSNELWAKIQEKKVLEDKLYEEENQIRKEEEIARESEKKATTEVKNKILTYIIAKEAALKSETAASAKIVETEKAEISRELKKIREEQAIFRILASTGTSIFMFTHEIQSLVESMKKMQNNFSTLLDKLSPEEKKKYESDYQRFSDRIEMIDEFGEFLGLTLGKESRSELKRLHLLKTATQAFAAFKWHLKEKGIKYELDINPTLRTPNMYKSELFSIFLNLITNSVKALKKSPERRIRVAAFETDEDRLIIQFMDSGKGLEKELWDEVFEAFVTYSEPDNRFGTGTGLGLKLVKDIIESYNGVVHFVDAPEDWKTCIEIELSQV